MSLVRYKYLEENGIISNRMQLARAIERYNFPKPVALGENTLAWPLEEVENWLKSHPALADGAVTAAYCLTISRIDGAVAIVAEPRIGVLFPWRNTDEWCSRRWRHLAWPTTASVGHGGRKAVRS